MRTLSYRNAVAALAIASSALFVLPAQGQNQRVNKANYKLAQKYSSQFLRQFSYGTSISPTWIGKTDRFHYSFRTSEGTFYWLVDAEARTKKPLFDHERLAAKLSEAEQKAMDPNHLNLRSIKVDKKTGKKMSFNYGSSRYEWVFADNTLKKIGRATRDRGIGRGRGRGGRGLNRQQLRELQRQQQRRQQEQEQRNRNERTRRGQNQEEEKKELTREELFEEFMKQEQEREQDRLDQERRNREEGRTSQTERNRGPRQRTVRGKTYAPDRSGYVFAKDHNLYYVPGTLAKPAVADAKADAKADDKKADDKKIVAASTKAKDGDAKKEGDAKKTGNGNGKGNGNGNGNGNGGRQPRRASYTYDVKKAVQLSKDGAEDYSFGGVTRSRTGTRNQQRTRTRGRGGRRGFGRGGGSRVTWSKDSKAFYVTRRDQRGVKELFLVNSIANPRPTLQKYKYPMPGEEDIRTTELHYWHEDSGKLSRVEPKWKDESYSNIRYKEKTGELGFMRRDRLLRNIEFCALDLKTGKSRVLFSEGSKDGYLVLQSPRMLEKKKQMIWWSQRTGWGHFYLYDLDGKLLNSITSGAFRASRIVSLDEEAGWLYFRGNGREKGEDIYHEHLYRVRLDGTGLTLLDPGNATHRSTLSPSKRFVVDIAQRVDMAPKMMLRDGEGNLVMDLEETDLSRLKAVGWKPAERFKVKAADGITDLYGNMWKPFDFDEKKKYPIIAHVYPGPQQEGLGHTFSTGGSRQQLANLGFIVIQVGHRGGAPTRSRQYANFGYYNLRDYGLADKKTAIEQLALRHPFIDVDKVGIYGHSGGGFMTAAALMQKPYNDFFKVGVSSAGNHDNNIYNNSWSERYHGLKVADGNSRRGSRGGRTGRGTGQRTGRGTGQRGRGTGQRGRGTGQRGRGTGQRGGRGTGQRGRGRGGRGTGERGGGRTFGGRGGRGRGGRGGGQTEQGGNTTRGNNTRGGNNTGTNTQDKTQDKKQDKVSEVEKTRFDIYIPTNTELAPNLKGHLLLVHGEIDNNVHPANTMRLVDALIKANKRFDLLIIPGARHGFGRASAYFNQRMWEYFAEHLLGDCQPGADIMEKSKRKDDN